MSRNQEGSSSARKKGKAGGDGKKGKIFLEDKSKLLSLIGDVTASKDSEVASKLAKQRSFSGGDDTQSKDVGKKQPKEIPASEKRKRDKDRALVEAKATLAAKAKEKKKRKSTKATTGESDPSASVKKKRVGFA